jgi:hypothetical protein
MSNVHLMKAAQKYGLATATGTVSSVGMAGFTLGEGYGSLMGAYGLGADNLLSAQVVTADGQLVTANAQEGTSRPAVGTARRRWQLWSRRFLGVSSASAHDRVIWVAAVSSRASQNSVTPF